MKKYLLIILGLFNIANAQNRIFITEGVIEYEKTVNMYMLVKSGIKPPNQTENQTFDQYKATNPQFKKLKSNLIFNKNQTLFKPVFSNENMSLNFPMAHQYNTIYTNLISKNSITQKNVYEQTFLVNNSIREIRWKLTGEMRDIAGYTCRRANAIIMDSIYVVAFYSIDIPVSGGPESFTGLPGMILGVALPHENVTWFATKVSPRLIQPEEITVPSKGQPIIYNSLVEKLESVLKSWGEYAKILMKAFLL